jgi:hypothetical protein
MSLKLYYKENDAFVEITSDDDLTNPLVTIHDGKVGDVITSQVYIRNDNTGMWYSNIFIKPVDLVDANPYGDVAYTETGWGVKLSKGATEPTSSEWEDIAWGNQIEMDDIGSNSLADTTTYSPLWMLITCPPNTDAQVKTDIVINTRYTENVVI